MQHVTMYVITYLSPKIDAGSADLCFKRGLDILYMIHILFKLYATPVYSIAI